MNFRSWQRFSRLSLDSSCPSSVIILSATTCLANCLNSQSALVPFLMLFLQLDGKNQDCHVFAFCSKCSSGGLQMSKTGTLRCSSQIIKEALQFFQSLTPNSCFVIYLLTSQPPRQDIRINAIEFPSKVQVLSIETTMELPFQC